MSKEPYFPLPLGQVVHDTTNHPWVYVGFRQTTVGSYNYHFVMSIPYKKMRFPEWQYNAVHRETLIKKFPDLAEVWKLGEEA